MRKKRIKCNQCHEEQETATIFIHIVECDRNIRHYAKKLIAELERELRE
jgi:hypothetical protein